MALITPRVRCGLPTNPREWLLEKKKTLPKSSIPSPVTLGRERPTVNTNVAQSPIIEGEFEELIDCYSAIDEHYWNPSSSSPKAPLGDPLIPGTRSQKSSLVKYSYASDRSSSVSEGSNVSLVSSASGKSARRKKRIFPGIFSAAALDSPLLSINTSLLSSNNNLSEEAGLAKQEFQLKSTLRKNRDGAQSPSLTHTGEPRGREPREPSSGTSRSQVSKRNSPSEPLPNTALREPVAPIALEESYWDELDVLEAYSSLDSEQNSRDSYSAPAKDDPVQMKFNVMISVGEKHSEHDDDDHVQLATYGSLSTGVPYSANSDLSRYSVESVGPSGSKS